jgi:hypothetical protein
MLYCSPSSKRIYSPAFKFIFLHKVKIEIRLTPCWRYNHRLKRTLQGLKPTKKRGRPQKGEIRVKESTRLERQQTMGLGAMIEDLPKVCEVGKKMNSKKL